MAKWCFLGSHELPDDARMIMPERGGAHICEACAKTERGQRLVKGFSTTTDYAPNQRATLGKWSRIYRALGTRRYKV